MNELNSILQKTLLAEKINQYVIYSPYIAHKAKAGQFVILRLGDGGERVLNPQQNKDLTRYLENQNSGGGGDVNITVHVTDSGVSTQSNQNEQKQLGQMIGNAVRTIIRQEQRQGGLLSK